MNVIKKLLVAAAVAFLATIVIPALY